VGFIVVLLCVALFITIHALCGRTLQDSILDNCIASALIAKPCHVHFMHFIKMAVGNPTDFRGIENGLIVTL
jgi:hypothetical protein